ncbi:MAG: hypothetical protein GX033_06590 [Firmicutes bacterium]|nr:hypothetical protein [Bacillota bacterium]
MKIKVIAVCFLILVVVTACGRRPNGSTGPIISLPDDIVWGRESRTTAPRATVVWRHRLSSEGQYFNHVLTEHPQGFMFGYFDRQGPVAAFSRTILDPATGTVLQRDVLEKVTPYGFCPDAIFHKEAEEIRLETDGGTLVLPQLPEAEGWFDCLLREDGVVLLGYDQAGRFITYLDAEGEKRGIYRPEPRGPKEIFVLETYGSQERLVDLGDGLLGAYGLTIRGLIALDMETGQLVWDYHIPMEDRICSVSVGQDGIWIGGLSHDYDGVVALLAPDGAVLRELEHPAPVVAIGALDDRACWFMAGWGGPDGDNKVYLLEHDRLAQEVLEDIEFGRVPEVNNSLVFLNSTQGILYQWQPGQVAQAYELPFYGEPNSTQMLGARDDMVLIQYKNEIYAILLEQ